MRQLIRNANRRSRFRGFYYAHATTGTSAMHVTRGTSLEVISAAGQTVNVGRLLFHAVALFMVLISIAKVATQRPPRN